MPALQSRSHWGFSAFVLSVVSVMACASAVHAQTAGDADRAAARDLGRQGLAALDQGDFTTAEERLTRAIALHDVPTLRLARARALRSLGRLVAAADDYRAIGRVPVSAGEPPVFASARREAAGELASLESIIPRLTLRLQGGEAKVRVAGSEWPAAMLGVARAIDPGEYAIEVIPADGQSSTQRLRIEPGEARVVTLDVPAAAAVSPADAAAAAAIPPAAPAAGPASEVPAPAAAERAPPLHLDASVKPRPNRTPAYIVVGAAAALLVAGLATGGLYLFKLQPDYDQANTLDADPDAVGRLHRKAETMSWVSGGLLGGALVAGGIGTYMLVSGSDPEDAERAGIQPVGLGRTELRVSVQF